MYVFEGDMRFEDVVRLSEMVSSRDAERQDHYDLIVGRKLPASLRMHFCVLCVISFHRTVHECPRCGNLESVRPFRFRDPF